MTFCDISKCHYVTISNFVTFLGFCHTVCIFFSFFGKTYNVRKSQIRASAGHFSEVPQIYTFRSYVSLSFGSDKSIISILAGGRINFLRRKSSDLVGELFSERNSFIEDGSNYSMIYESSPQPITWNKLYASNASPENTSPKKALRKDRSIFNSKN